MLFRLLEALEFLGERPLPHLSSQQRLVTISQAGPSATFKGPCNYTGVIQIIQNDLRT